jgi:hypothetical protein
MSLTRTVPSSVPSLFQSSNPVASVRAVEEDLAADPRDVEGIPAGRAACLADVLDRHRAVRRAVASPELVPVEPVIGVEDDDIPQGCQLARRRPVGTKPDVLHHRGSPARAVRLPKLRPVRTVVGHKEHIAAGVSEGTRATARTTRVGIREHERAPARDPVTDPWLNPVYAVVGLEVQAPAQSSKGLRKGWNPIGGARRDLRDRDRRAGAITSPQFSTMHAVRRSEIQSTVEHSGVRARARNRVSRARIDVCNPRRCRKRLRTLNANRERNSQGENHRNHAVRTTREH